VRVELEPDTKADTVGGASMEQDSRPWFNRLLGWVFLIAGFMGAVWLDRWSFSERDPALLVGSPRMVARHAQAVVLAMGFLQFAVTIVLEGMYLPTAPRRAIELLTGAGAVIYVLGIVTWPTAMWAVPAGALVSFAGFLVLLWMCFRQRISPDSRPGLASPGDAGARGMPEAWIVVPIFCFGMLLNAAMGLFYIDPDLFLPAYVGPEDGVRQRMLRLARAAAIALSLVTLLYRGLAERSGSQPIVRRGQLALWCGTLGMSAILTLASFTFVEVKFLLPIPALTTFIGTCAAAWLAGRLGLWLEMWGWLLVATSMGIGLFMGMYAFDGPVPAPGPLAGYNDYVRRLSRLAHAYCIILGLLSILIARESNGGYAPTWPVRLSKILLVAGTVTTLGMILLLAMVDLPLNVLIPGPALVTVALILCLAPKGLTRAV
jgi:hypothetical protein